MAHSHLGVRYFIKQLESQSLPDRKDRRPAEISQLIDELSTYFEPLEGVARVGFDCRLAEGCWNISLYLGRAEFVGGPHDGSHHCSDFSLDLQGIQGLLGETHELEWIVSHTTEGGQTYPRTIVRMSAMWEGYPVRLFFAGSPPVEAGPALRRFADGTCELL